jgi:hypothetical protein
LTRARNAIGAAATATAYKNRRLETADETDSAMIKRSPAIGLLQLEHVCAVKSAEQIIRQ